MPELLTRHPEIVLDLMSQSGAKCGEGLKQEILMRCPADRFCVVPGGELCVYGLDQADQMTQIRATELCAAGTSCAQTPPSSWVVLGALLVGVLAVRARWRKSRVRGPTPRRQ